MSEFHTPVLLEQSVSALVGDVDGAYADATFGGGGHSREILRRLGGSGSLMAFDRDAEALAQAPEDSRLTLVHNNFRFIHNYALLYGVSFDGIIADLGVSSHQFDTPRRGFSFRFNAPLDMRMNGAGESTDRDSARSDDLHKTGEDKAGGKTAADVLNTYSEEDLERVLRLYGEIREARRAARLIAAARAHSPISTTERLGEVLKPLTPSYAPHKYLAKVYQALRIEVNDEMRSLEKFLQGAARSLKSGGRLVVITYHSLEDRMVKNFIRSGSTDGVAVKDGYGRTDAPLIPVGRKPVLPPESEIASNTRARSAKLRIARKP